MLLPSRFACHLPPGGRLYEESGGSKPPPYMGGADLAYCEYALSVSREAEGCLPYNPLTRYRGSSPRGRAEGGSGDRSPTNL